MFKEISEISIPTAGLSLPTSSSTYTQVFKYDQIIPRNLVKKTSTENSRNTPDPLNYDLDYTYAPGFFHRVERAGDKNFVYDLSGNLILEYDGEKQENPEEDDYVIINQDNNVYGTEGAWGYGTNGNGGDVPVYSNKRRYEWDDRNQLIRTVDDFYDTYYVYNNEGQRVAKYTSNTTAMSETLYFNNFWTWHYDTANEYYAEGQYSKNIYLGETRIVTRLLTEEKKSNKDLEVQRTFYYHTDHLGSASLVTNPDGEIYERLEYTPYGEVWVDITENKGTLYLPYKFSAKEKDSETGLYYYGARYLDPKYSLWKSADPALGEYIPVASTNDEWSKKNSNLPGMGGLFNPTNFHLYHYAGNNPIRYIDPDGESTTLEDFEYQQRMKYSPYNVNNKPKTVKHKKSFTRSLLNLFIGKDNVDKIWNEPYYDGFMSFSDQIIFAALETPCVIVGEISDYVGLFALATGNVPLAASAAAVSKGADLTRFGISVLKAYTTEDWSDVAKQMVSYGISTIISFEIKKGFVDIRVSQSTKNGGFYQKGHRGRLSDKAGMRKAFIQKMTPEIGKKGAEVTFDLLWDKIQKAKTKQNNEE